MDGSTHPVAANAAPDQGLNRRQIAKAATTRKVADAARALFERDGYDAATIRQIAAEAGMSTGAVFASYRDKAALYEGLFGHPPIPVEQGRELLRVLLNLIEVRPANWDDDEDPQAATAWAAADSIVKRLTDRPAQECGSLGVEVLQ